MGEVRSRGRSEPPQSLGRGKKKEKTRPHSRKKTLSKAKRTQTIALQFIVTSFARNRKWNRSLLIGLDMSLKCTSREGRTYEGQGGVGMGPREKMWLGANIATTCWSCVQEDVFSITRCYRSDVSESLNYS